MKPTKETNKRAKKVIEDIVTKDNMELGVNILADKVYTMLGVNLKTTPAHTVINGNKDLPKYLTVLRNIHKRIANLKRKEAGIK